MGDVVGEKSRRKRDFSIWEFNTRAKLLGENMRRTCTFVRAGRTRPIAPVRRLSWELDGMRRCSTEWLGSDTFERVNSSCATWPLS